MIMIVVTKRQKDKNTNRQNKSNKNNKKYKGPEGTPRPPQELEQDKGAIGPQSPSFLYLYANFRLNIISNKYIFNYISNWSDGSSDLSHQ